jgi:glycerophosphoryl diester phosphodiesterase
MLPDMSRAQMQIIGHRGAAGHGPAGAEPAIQAALGMGATAIELDVQFAADSTPVVCHDRTLERMAGVKGTIRDQTIRELSGYDIGFKSGDRYRGVRLLSLEEATQLIPDEVEVHVEIKGYDNVNAKHLRGLLAVLKCHGGLSRCVITSSSETILAALGSTDRKIRRGLRTAGKQGPGPEKAAALGCASLHPDAVSTSANLVEACREMNLKIYPHTANDGSAMRKLLALGVDGLSTDHPDRLAEAAGTRPATRQRRPSRPATSRTARQPEPPPPEAPHSPPEETAAAPEEERTRRRRSPAHRSRTRPRRAGAPAEGKVQEAAREKGVVSGSAGPAEPEASGDAAPATRRKRRRGRRGGKREHARRERRTATLGQEPDPGGPIELEPVDDTEEPVELLGEIHAELAAETKASQKPANAETMTQRKRPRGRRGGRRIQARRNRRRQTGNSSDS